MQSYHRQGIDIRNVDTCIFRVNFCCISHDSKEKIGADEAKEEEHKHYQNGILRKYRW